MTRDEHLDNQARPVSVAFLLAQIGSHAAGAFAERLGPLKLTPPQAGVLRQLAGSPGLSQRALADTLSMHAPRLVSLIDELERRRLVKRTRAATDRRTYALALTANGDEIVTRLSTLAREHDKALTAALDPAERQQLGSLLKRIAADQGLAPGIHPGYRRLGRRP